MSCVETVQPIVRHLAPARVIEGMSAVLLPVTSSGSPDLKTFQTLLKRTVEAALVPAVNMDTGYVNFLSPAQRCDVLTATRDVLRGRRFIAGAFVETTAGDPIDDYRRAIAPIIEAGGTPIIFQCPALATMDDQALLRFYQSIGESCDAFLGFELGQMFAPFGRVYSLDFYCRWIEIPHMIGAKHSSLDRIQEWQRLEIRDRTRPDFRIYTGNDLAIDMVTYGSDYLLGLSAFWPEAFARRDRYWREDDARFWRLNDLLQYLGLFAFRAPVPAYKHSAAQFLAIRGLLKNDAPHPRAARRRIEDLVVLRDIAQRIEAEMQS